MTIDNPKIQDAHKYPDEVYILAAVKGEPVFRGIPCKDIWQMSFKKVSKVKKMMQELTDDNLFKLMRMFYPKCSFKNVRCLEFYRAFNYIKEQVSHIYESEKLLEVEPDEKMKQAGIEGLSVFGEVNILDDLGRDFATPPHKVEKWSYNWVFVLSLKRKRESEINRNIK